MMFALDAPLYRRNAKEREIPVSIMHSNNIIIPPESASGACFHLKKYQFSLEHVLITSRRVKIQLVPNAIRFN